MQGIKNLFILSTLLFLTTCSKDGYGPSENYSVSSNLYSPPTSDYGSSSSTSTSVTQYSLTVTAGSGGSVSTSGGTYDDGSSVSITATPNDGYEFAGWNGSNSTSSTISLTIDSNTIIEALFTEIPAQVSTETASTETASTETVSTETTSTETTSTETTSTETTSTETASTETTSTETTSSTYNLNVTAQNSSNYTLSGSDQNGNVSGNDPSISAKVGDTLSFNVNSPGHDFFIIINSNGGFISTNLPSGVSNNGTANGTVTWTPSEAGTYYYICEFHPAMIGTITITQ